MKGLGSGEQGEFTFLDWISLLSFAIGLQNLDLNITADDMQKATERLDSALREQVRDIHTHLERQDAILRELRGEKNANS